MIHILWEFRVKKEKRREFERHYSVLGTWVALFRNSPSYKGTTLMCDTEDRNRYVTTDIWEDFDSFRLFRRQFGGEYKALDSECEKLTESERCLGVFQPL